MPLVSVVQRYKSSALDDDGGETLQCDETGGNSKVVGVLNHEVVRRQTVV